MRRNPWIPLVIIVVAAVGGVVANIVAGNAPLLGLDLQSGVSVVLRPAEPVPDDQIDQAIAVIRNRVDAFGVAEPSITRQGDSVLVELPGVQEQDRALELVGQTAELRFRPVVGVYPPGDGTPLDTLPPDLTATTAPGATTASTTPADAGAATTAPATTAPAASPETTAAAAPAPDGGPGRRVPAQEAPPTTSPVTTAPDATATTAPPADSVPPASVPDTAAPPTSPPLTPRDADRPEAVVVLPQTDPGGAEVARFELGPTALTGSALEGAQATFDQNTGQWTVRVTFTPEGIGGFNNIAGQCFRREAACPSGQLAIALDGVVTSAPEIRAERFDRGDVEISGGGVAGFTETDARDLALVLRFGALPVELERQTVQTVSPTLGEEALRAGLAAGIGGLVLVGLYVIVYYRILGVVAVFSLIVSAMLLWSVLALLGTTQGLALTLAGVTGIIVSIGVQIDSNIVYYEKLKEDVLAGRSLRSSVDRSFASAIRTVINADIVALIGAALLYFLSVGPVRGFAFTLGVATLIDLVTSYMFMHPAAQILVRSRLGKNPHAFGIPTRTPPPTGGTPATREPVGVAS